LLVEHNRESRLKDPKLGRVGRGSDADCASKTEELAFGELGMAELNISETLLSDVSFRKRFQTHWTVDLRPPWHRRPGSA
jgi:hypothetical protein